MHLEHCVCSQSQAAQAQYVNVETKCNEMNTLYTKLKLLIYK